MDLSEFLLARIEEDEEEFRRNLGTPPEQERHKESPDYNEAYIDRLLVQLLAECEAKRRIIGHCQATIAEADEYDEPTQRTDVTYTLRLLALPFADHPDFDEEWRLA